MHRRASAGERGRPRRDARGELRRVGGARATRHRRRRPLSHFRGKRSLELRHARARAAALRLELGRCELCGRGRRARVRRRLLRRRLLARRERQRRLPLFLLVQPRGVSD